MNDDSKLEKVMVFYCRKTIVSEDKKSRAQKFKTWIMLDNRYIGR